MILSLRSPKVHLGEDLSLGSVGFSWEIQLFTGDETRASIPSHLSVRSCPEFSLWRLSNRAFGIFKAFKPS